MVRYIVESQKKFEQKNLKTILKEDTVINNFKKMDNEIKTNDNIGAWIRLLGILILISGIILIGISQLMESTSSNSFPDNNDNALQILTDKLNNIELIAEKTKKTILGGFLVVVGLQLSLVSNKVIKEIREQFKQPI